MFVLSEMKDTVRIQPWLFNTDVNEAIVNVLNKKFANKVSITKYLKSYCRILINQTNINLS